MTVETNQFVTLDEVESLRFECHACRATLTIPLNNKQTPPMQCGGCGQQWFQGVYDERFQNLSTFVQRMRIVLESQMAFDLTLGLHSSLSDRAASGKG